jgi:hypothetical protein
MNRSKFVSLSNTFCITFHCGWMRAFFQRIFQPCVSTQNSTPENFSRLAPGEMPGACHDCTDRLASLNFISQINQLLPYATVFSTHSTGATCTFGGVHALACRHPLPPCYPTRAATALKTVSGVDWPHFAADLFVHHIPHNDTTAATVSHDIPCGGSFGLPNAF